MTEPDIRTTQLDWIRDGFKWLVGVATGLLAVSATYFYDRFEQAPRLGWLLWIAWVALIVAALAGILAAFTTWKNLGSNSGFGLFLKALYGTAMFGFTLGFVLLAVVLLVNAASLRKPKAFADIFPIGLKLPAFDPASSTPSGPDFVTAVCAARKALADSGSLSALVVGRFDGRELSRRAQSRYTTNHELAQRRSDHVSAYLTDSAKCASRALLHVVTLTAGPRLSLPMDIGGGSADALLADDRRVEIYGFQVRR